MTRREAPTTHGRTADLDRGTALALCILFVGVILSASAVRPSRGSSLQDRDPGVVQRGGEIELASPATAPSPAAAPVADLPHRSPRSPLETLEGRIIEVRTVEELHRVVRDELRSVIERTRAADPQERV